MISADLRQGDIFTHRALLSRLFGHKTFDFLLHVYLGLGSTDLRPGEDDERKSIGTESTFRDLSSPDELRAKLRHTAEELEKDCLRADWAGRTLHLKLKRDTYEVYTRQRSLHGPCWRADDLYNFALPLLEREMPIRVRLLGLRLTHLTRIKRKNAAEFFGSFGIEVEGQRKRPLEDQSDRPDASDHDTGQDEAWKPSDDSVLRQIKRHALEPQLQGRAQAATVDRDELPRCPVCGRRIAGDEMTANKHVEHCLDTKAIRDALRGDNVGSESTGRPKQGHAQQRTAAGLNGGISRWLRTK